MIWQNRLIAVCLCVTHLIRSIVTPRTQQFMAKTLQHKSFYKNCGVAPVYLSDLFVLSSSCPGRRSLRSASRGDYLIPRSYTATKQNRAFSAAGPSIWNGLPFELLSLTRDFSIPFYSRLKTFLFARAWAGSASE